MAYDWLGANIVPSAITYSLAFAALLIGSITDLKTREVPDWVNWGLVLSGIGLNALFTFVYNQLIVEEISYGNAISLRYLISPDSFLISSIVGLLIAFCIAYFMFDAGQWGGGDSKMIMGLGAMIGIDFSKSMFLFGFFINALLAGAVYGLLWSIMLAVKNRKKFSREFRKGLLKESAVKTKKIMLIGLVLMTILLFFTEQYPIKVMMLSLAFLVMVSFYLWIFVKAIEKSSMYKLVEPARLTEGDWIVNDVYVSKKYICGPKDLGIDKRQIRKLVEFYKKGKVRRILIKEGIPFVPSFLIAFVITFLFGNALMWIL
ncbi:prepilin peptidase [Candidatus Woesearchaeota archaeon]|nr:prepilin peptidase [Candidatus Woesearchaeota archaeon]